MRNLWIAAAALVLVACGGGGSDSEGGPSAMERAETVADAVGAEKVVEITEDNDPNDLIGRPNGYIEAAVIYAAGAECDDLGVTCGATVEVFEDADAAQKRSDYIQGLLEDAPMLGSEYHYFDGATLLRVSGDLAPSDAEEYEAAFN